MAYYFITASKDATVYLQQPNQNTGLDEILEVSKIYYGNLKDVSRVLIKFDLEQLISKIESGKIELSDVRLSLKETESTEIPLEYEIFLYPISGSWEMGMGTRFDDISTAGVTWNFREGDSKIDWFDGTGDFPIGTDGGQNDGRGGVWYNTVSASQKFSYQSADINVDVKNIINHWVSGTLPNEGFIIKYSNVNEGFVTSSVLDGYDTNDYGQLKFFSKETNTIYQPKLVIGWDSQIYETGSLQSLDIDNSGIVIRAKNIKNEYKLNTVTKLRIVGRERYPLKTFTNSFAYNEIKYLPKTSYYQIKDLASDDVIIPFSKYSTINCDSDGNYIELDFTNWETNRVYKIEFKIENDGNVLYFDNNITFKIVNE